jgi:hypothetical protein
MKIRAYVLLIGSVACVAWPLPAKIALSATLLSAEQAADVVSVRDLTVREGEVSGDVVNKSQRLVREVLLQIRYTWFWNNELRPGKDDPGRTVYYTVEKEIPAGQSMRFTYKPAPPLPSRADGVFETTVSVAGFAQVYR